MVDERLSQIHGIHPRLIHERRHPWDSSPAGLKNAEPRQEGQDSFPKFGGRRVRHRWKTMTWNDVPLRADGRSNLLTSADLWKDGRLDLLTLTLKFETTSLFGQLALRPAQLSCASACRHRYCWNLQ